MSGFRTSVHRGEGGGQVAQCPIQDFFKKGASRKPTKFYHSPLFYDGIFKYHDIMMYAPLNEF